MLLFAHDAAALLERFGVPVRPGIRDAGMARHLSVALDRATRGPLVSTGRSGPAATDRLRLPVDPLLGLQPYAVRRVLAHLGVPASHRTDGARVVEGLWRAFVALDGEAVELDPLHVTAEGALVAGGARVVVDDRARGRHPDLPPPADADPLEEEAATLAAYPIPMGGELAVAVAGAGALMATIDQVDALGGTVAGGLDMSGPVGHDLDRLTRVLALTRRFGQPRAFLFAFYVRTWKGDLIARAALAAVDDLRPAAPLVVRLAGNRWQEGHAILREAGVPVTDSLLDACRWAVAAARGPAPS